AYFRAATRAAFVLEEFRAPWRGRSTPVNAWWGSFDLAVNLFSGNSVQPPAPDPAAVDVSPGRYDETLGEYLLDMEAAAATPDPHATALAFARAVGRQ